MPRLDNQHQTEGRSRNARLNAFTAREMFQRLRVEDPESPDSELVLQVHLWITQRDRRGFINLYGGRTVAPARHTVYQWISGRIGNTYTSGRAPSLLGARPPVTSPRESRAGVGAQLDRIEAKVDRIVEYCFGKLDGKSAFTNSDFVIRQEDFHASV